ncbi:MAG: lipid A export permease/ATP-binding protein MsbA [Thiotrichales bacterium]
MSSLQSDAGPSVYRRLAGYSFRYWPYLVVAIAGMVITAASEPAFAALMKPLLDGSFVERDADAIRWVPVLLIAVFFASSLATFITSYFMARVGRAVIMLLRNEICTKYLKLPSNFYDTHNSGGLISRLTYDVEQVAEAATTAMTILIRDTLTVIGLLGWMLYLSWQLTLGFFVVAPFVGIIATWITKRFRRISKRIQSSMGDVTHVAQEIIEGERVIKVFGGEGYETERFEQVNDENRRLHLKLAATKSAAAPILQFLVAVVLAGIIMFATRQQFHEQISVGTFISFLTATMLLLQPVRRLANVNATIQKGIAAGESLFGIIDTQAEEDSGTKILNRAEAAIRFEHVSFTYDAQKGPVLQDINLDIPAGTTCALVGRSGSGKTTLVNLLPRLYPLSEGAIYLDGMDIRSIRLDSLRDQIAYVGQHVTLFNDTVRNNIAYGRLRDATDEQVIQALKMANALDFVMAMPDGLNTQVGERGLLLSGGQRQRLSIARALLKDAPLLILDEATAALDSESERMIQAALETLLTGRTTLVIAHRLSTVKNADNIVVLENGKIVEQGRHDALLEKSGAYSHLYELQFA